MSKKLSFDLFENILPDTKLLYQSSNSKNILKLQNVVLKVLKEQLTSRQKQILMMYFFDKKNIPSISNELNINKSTVSRSINSSIKKLHSILKYYL